MHQSEKKNMLDWTIIILCWSIFTYFMGTVHILFQTGFEDQAICLVLSFALLFLMKMQDPSSGWWLRAACVIFLVVGVLSAGYVKVFYSHLEASVGFPERLDIVVGIALIITVLIGSWVSWGPMFSILTVVAMLYFFLGHHLPQPLYHPPIEFGEAVSRLSVGLQGIFSGLLGVVSDFLMLLVIFGCLLDTAGANQFFMQLGKLAGRVLQGGPAHAAVIGSGLVGTTTGAAAANVIITGSITIPLMKKLGYKADTAAGIEAAASTGSQLMPPVMGVAAFLMADFLGIPYLTIMVAGIVPALLYYFGIALAIQLIAKKQGIEPLREEVDRTVMIERGPLTLLPIFLLITLLTFRFSISYTIFFCILLVLGLMCLRSATRPSLSALTFAVVRGAKIGAQMAMVLATVGIISQIVITTGLGIKLAHLIYSISFGHLGLIIFYTALLCFFMGQGIPTAPAYVLMAILIAPTLVQKGLPELQVHFFVFYFAVIAAISPPVALASLTASKIANSNMFKTGFQAMKLASSGFVIPFLFFSNPALLLQPDTLRHGVGSILITMLLVTEITVGLFGYFLTSLNMTERLFTLAGSLLLLVYLMKQNGIALIAGLAVSLIFMLLHIKKHKTERRYAFA